MTDAELWQACVESGFTLAWEHWPTNSPGQSTWRLGFAEGAWQWECGRSTSPIKHGADARARILAALVEWATTEGRGIESLFRYSTPTEHMKCGAEVHPCNRGEGTCPVAALLECYRQSKENA